MGIDLSAAFIERAEALARELGVDDRVEFRRGDLRELDLAEQFDGAVCWFTSFGFHDERDDREVLTRICRSLRAGGKLAMELMGRELALSMLSTDRSLAVLVSEIGEDAIVDRARLSQYGKHAILDRLIVRGEVLRRTKLTLRLFEPAEIASWLESAGLKDVQIEEIAEEDRELFAKLSLIVIATR